LGSHPDERGAGKSLRPPLDWCFSPDAVITDPFSSLESTGLSFPSFARPPDAESGAVASVPHPEGFYAIAYFSRDDIGDLGPRSLVPSWLFFLNVLLDFSWRAGPSLYPSSRRVAFSAVAPDPPRARRS